MSCKILLFISAFSVASCINAQNKTTSLLDETLSNFEVWIGVPHNTVEGLPEGTFQSNNVHTGVPLGLNNDLKKVFTVEKEAAEIVLKVSGEIYAGLTTKESFKNYHLSVMFKWGDKKWEPRLNAKRDSGILYHCYGKHGRFWKTWKTSLEYQVQENDLGDFIPLGGNSESPKVDGPKTEIRGRQDGLKNMYDPKSDTYLEKIGYTNAYKEVDAPHGQWNHLEIYVFENDAVHVVNNEIVMVVENAINPETGSPLTSGQIQIQSEAAECYYKNLTITKINKFPRKVRKRIILK